MVVRMACACCLLSPRAQAALVACFRTRSGRATGRQRSARRPCSCGLRKGTTRLLWPRVYGCTHGRNGALQRSAKGSAKHAAGAPLPRDSEGRVAGP